MADSDFVTEAAAEAMLDAIAADVSGLDPAAGVLWSDLDIYNRSTTQPADKLIVGDVSDTTGDVSGTPRILTLPGLAEVQRRLTTNLAVTDTAAGFATDTYVAGSEIVLPEAPSHGSMYHVIVKISKTAAGTATPIFNLRTGTGVIGDTSRAVATFAAGTAVADVALVELWFIFIAGTLPNHTINFEGNARNNLATTGWSGASKQATATSAAFDPSSLAGSTIGLSYNGGTGAVHTIQFVRADWTQ